MWKLSRTEGKHEVVKEAVGLLVSILLLNRTSADGQCYITLNMTAISTIYATFLTLSQDRFLIITDKFKLLHNQRQHYHLHILNNLYFYFFFFYSRN